MTKTIFVYIVALCLTLSPRVYTSKTKKSNDEEKIRKKPHLFCKY